MHDAKGRPLQKGDKVLIPCIIDAVYNTEDYCNIDMSTQFGRRPDNMKEHIGGINTGVLVRNNPGDDNSDLVNNKNVDVLRMVIDV